MGETLGKRYSSVQSILTGLSSLRSLNPQVDRLLENLSRYGDLILVGGAVRDLARARQPRDYDIIVDGPDTEFERVLDDFPDFTYRRNRFGGYKINFNGIELDIWGIRNNWAFRESIYDAKYENIPKGAFYNFDALCFNIQKQHLDWGFFSEALEKQTLDILLDEEAIAKNPSPEVNVVRAWTIHKEWNLQLSERVQDYIRRWFASVENPEECLRQAERKHYGWQKSISNEDYAKLMHEFDSR